MSAASIAMPEPEVQWTLPSRGRVAMLSLIAAESAIFSIFLVAYLFYLGKSLSGPTPKEILRVPILFTICLLSSSISIHLAVRSLQSGKVGAFTRWWFLTFALGAAFLAGTAIEWRHLIYDEGFTIQTNLFGTTYFSLVGLHAFHVVMGLIALFTVWMLTLLGNVRPEHADRVDVLALYWHFVDSVWVVVFMVVYVIGR
jgi:cytochrome c oxidase subunit 3/cytochrome o ubiquinol oxidase subunit 3